MTGEAYCQWAETVYVAEAIRRRREVGEGRALLIIDGHSSRRNEQAAKALEQAKIDVLILPAHATHILEPLDDWVFAAFNQALRRSMRTERWSDWILRIEDAWASSATRLKVLGSFEHTGIWPFSLENVIRHPLLCESPAMREEQQGEARSKRRQISNSGSILTPESLREIIDQRFQRKRKRDESGGFDPEKQGHVCSICLKAGHNKTACPERTK